MEKEYIDNIEELENLVEKIEVYEPSLDEEESLNGCACACGVAVGGGGGTPL